VGNLPTNASVRIERNDADEDLVLTGLDRLEEPASLVALRNAVAAHRPRVDLPELLLEIDAHTGFAGAFTHASEADARARDLATTLCAVLLAEACNTGLEPLVRPDLPALRRSRLSWVRQNYLRAETLTQANARLVAAQSGIGLARQWGGPAPVLFRSFESDTRHQGDRIWQRYIATSSSGMRFASRSPVA
jgi:hypothetical protein